MTSLLLPFPALIIKKLVTVHTGYVDHKYCQLLATR